MNLGRPMAPETPIPPARQRLLSELEAVEKRASMGEISDDRARMEADRILQYLERLTFLDVRAEMDAAAARRRLYARLRLGLAVLVVAGLLYAFLR